MEPVGADVEEGLGVGVEHLPGDDPGEDEAVVPLDDLGGDLGVEVGHRGGQDGVKARGLLRLAVERSAPCFCLRNRIGAGTRQYLL